MKHELRHMLAQGRPPGHRAQHATRPPSMGYRANNLVADRLPTGSTSRKAQSPSCRACRTPCRLQGRRFVDERAQLPRESDRAEGTDVPPSALTGRGRPVVPVSGRQLSNRLPRYALRGSGSRRRSCIGGTDPNGGGPPQLPPLHGGIELYECHYGPEPDGRHGAKVPSSGDLGPHSLATGLSVTRQAPHRSPLYRRP